KLVARALCLVGFPGIAECCLQVFHCWGVLDQADRLADVLVLFCGSDVSFNDPLGLVLVVYAGEPEREAVCLIKDSPTMEDLQAAFSNAWKAYKTKGARDQLTAAKDQRKKELLEAPIDVEFEETGDDRAA
ncbi:hypothetical protein ACV344_32045, partial [Pseudomonas aeruginosa]